MTALDVLTRFNEEDEKRKRQAVPPEPENAMQQPAVPRDKDPNLIGLAMTGAKTARQDVDKLMPGGFQLAGTAAAQQNAYELSSAQAMRRPDQARQFMEALTSGGADANTAAQLATAAIGPAEQAMQQAATAAGTIKPKIDAYGNITGFEEVQPQPKYMSTASGVFDPMTGKIVEGTQPQKQFVETMGPQGPAVRDAKTGMVGFWDPKLGDYSRWKMPSGGQEVRNPTTGELIFRSGGADYSILPEYGAAADGGRKEAPAAAVAYLQANPENAEMFKAKYGYLPKGF